MLVFADLGNRVRIGTRQSGSAARLGSAARRGRDARPRVPAPAGRWTGRVGRPHSRRTLSHAHKLRLPRSNQCDRNPPLKLMTRGGRLHVCALA
eukprot:2747901-Prymnesium_polylepis.2